MLALEYEETWVFVVFLLKVLFEILELERYEGVSWEVSVMKEQVSVFGILIDQYDLWLVEKIYFFSDFVEFFFFLLTHQIVVDLVIEIILQSLLQVIHIEIILFIIHQHIPVISLFHALQPDRVLKTDQIRNLYATEIQQNEIGLKIPY